MKKAGITSESVNSSIPEVLRNLTVDNKIQVQLSGVPFTVELDSEPIFNKILQLQETHSIKQGRGDIE